MLEYAICFPIFIGIVLALLYILRWFYTTSVLQYASYEAGRMLSQSEILAVPEVDYCGNGGSLSELDSSCVAFYNNLKEATDKADSILRTLLGGGAYSQLKTYKLYDREVYRQYGYSIPMGFPAIETKLLFLRPGEVAQDTEGNLINHTNREPGQKVTSSTQCLNRATGWPSPLCGNQKMQDIMRDKPFIVSAQVNEIYSMPFIGKQTFPAIGTQVFYAAGSEAISEIVKIPTPTPTRTPTPSPSPTRTLPPTFTPTHTPTSAWTPVPPTPTWTPVPEEPVPGLENYDVPFSSVSPCYYYQNWTIHYLEQKTSWMTCTRPCEGSYETVEVCTIVGKRRCQYIDGVRCTPFSEDTCQCCDNGFYYDCNCRFDRQTKTQVCDRCYDPPVCSEVWSPKFFEKQCELKQRYVMSCPPPYPCQNTEVRTFDVNHCTRQGEEPAPGFYGPDVTVMAVSPIGNPYLACGCGAGPCKTVCRGGREITGCRGDYDCVFNPCWNPRTGNYPSCSLNVNATCVSQCG